MDVVDIGQGDVRGRTCDDVGAIVRHHDLTATLQSDAVLDQFQLAGRARRVERDGASIVDRAGERQQGAVADRHRAAVGRHRVLVELEVVGRERGRRHAIDRDRLAVAQGQNRVAVGVVGQVGLHVGEAGKAGIADEVDLIAGRIEVMD